MSCPADSSDSTSSPAAVSRRETSAVSTGPARDTYSRSQESGTRISDLHPERPAEPHVALYRLPDLGHPALAHHATPEAAPEGETAVTGPADAGRHQHAGDGSRAARNPD